MGVIDHILIILYTYGGFQRGTPSSSSISNDGIFPKKSHHPSSRLGYPHVMKAPIVVYRWGKSPQIEIPKNDGPQNEERPNLV